MLSCCDATHHPCPLERVLRASLCIWEWSLGYKYFAPTGLETVFVARCSLLVIRESIVMLSSLEHLLAPTILH